VVHGASLPAIHRDMYAFLLVSQGRTPNYVVQTTVREMVGEAGAVEVTAEQWSMRCRG